MAYLDNTSVTIDAILTKKGRELLARGDGTFNIVKFALADDEIDYTLWDSSHTSGTNYYGEAIENLPLVEAIPDEDLKKSEYRKLKRLEQLTRKELVTLQQYLDQVLLQSRKQKMSISSIMKKALQGIQEDLLPQLLVSKVLRLHVMLLLI